MRFEARIHATRRGRRRARGRQPAAHHGRQGRHPAGGGEDRVPGYDRAPTGSAASIAEACRTQIEAAAPKELCGAAQRACGRPSEAVPADGARTAEDRRGQPGYGRAAGGLRPATGSRPGRIVFPVWAVSADRQLAAWVAAGQPAGNLERTRAAALVLQLDGQHQHPDELLAGRNLQPDGVPRAAVRSGAGPQQNRRENGDGELRMPRLGVASQCGYLAALCAGGKLRTGVADLGQLADERAVVLRASLGALLRSRAIANFCARGRIR